MMEKSLQLPVINPTSSSSPPRNTSTTASIASNPLKALNKSSYKISKPPSRNPNPNPFRSSSPPPPPLPPPPNGGGGTQPPQPQPPVYNIDKDDFRDVVQKLTGSPAHHRPSPPPPLSSTATTGNRLPISRLHRIRPPPLAQLLPSPPPPSAAPGEGWTRPPLSPLPPLPAVSAAAESPITAYMRRLRGGGSPAISPPSPLGFGCVPPMMSMMMPTSPVPPMSSPKWRDT